MHIVKASSSVMLTLCVAETSKSHEEEVNLLQNPEALWTVLAVNCPPHLASNYEPAEYATPVAQFIRGISASLGAERLGAQSIYDKLREELISCDLDGLFDDEHFTKSHLYHRAIKTCDELGSSIASSLRFIKRAFKNHLTTLSAKAHSYETAGVSYWTEMVNEEMFALEEPLSQISLLCTQVQESVRSASILL